ncbi:MAG: YihA family ribosome biogenesis GTP-binding protein [Clostridiales bacterium]|nr:YihA family ribosome biogenesis GTP-binding protein [Clostridiales bacterium]
MQIKKAQFIKSIADYSTAKIENIPQIAIIGRSNVGKSSLINYLCNSKKLAKVSSSPGKTRLINLFKINEQFYLVDLPGYGYAKVSKTEQERWSQMLEYYMNNSDNLQHIFLLMDIRREPSDLDHQMSLWIQSCAIPCTIIATKCDKIAKSKRKQVASLLSDKLAMTFRTHTILFSTLAKMGKQELLARFDDIL